MCTFDSKWLRDCPNDFKRVFHRRHVNDIFALFSSPDHTDKFKEYLSSKYPNLNLFIEEEKNGCLPFLDINNFCENEKFATKVYRKRTFSVVYTNFKSFIHETCKLDLIKSLLFRCFSLCPDKTSYPLDFVDKCIKVFLDKILAPKPVVSAVHKKDLVTALPLSLQIRTKIHGTRKNKLPYCKIQFVFQTK